MTWKCVDIDCTQCIENKLAKEDTGGELILILRRIFAANVNYHFPQDIYKWINDKGVVYTCPRDLCAWKKMKDADFLLNKPPRESRSGWRWLSRAGGRWAVRGGSWGQVPVLVKPKASPRAWAGPGSRASTSPSRRRRWGGGGGPSSCRVSGSLACFWGQRQERWPLLGSEAKVKRQPGSRGMPGHFTHTPPRWFYFFPLLGSTDVQASGRLCARNLQILTLLEVTDVVYSMLRLVLLLFLFPFLGIIQFLP